MRSTLVLVALVSLAPACAGAPAETPDGGDADAGSEPADGGGTDAGSEPVYTEWPNAVSFASSDPWLPEHHAQLRKLRPRILALDFVNAKSLAEATAQLQQMVAVLSISTAWHGYSNSHAEPFVEPELTVVDLRDPDPPADWPYGNSTLLPRQDPVQGTWGLDYGAFFTEAYAQHLGLEDPDQPGKVLTLCQAFDRGLVHEVWLYLDGQGSDASAAEILELKPYYDAQRRRRTDVPMNRCAGNGCFDPEGVIPCDRTVRIAAFNSSRGPGCFLESLSHGFESIGAWNPDQLPSLSRYFIPFANYGLDTRLGLPIPSWYQCPMGQDCISYPDPTTAVWDLGDGRSGTIEDYDPVCGNVHFPPNARRHYDIWNRDEVRTSCEHYRDGTDETTLYTWSRILPYKDYANDCDGPFLMWWRQNVPGLDNDALDDDGKPMLPWWPYLYY